MDFWDFAIYNRVFPQLLLLVENTNNGVKEVQGNRARARELQIWNAKIYNKPKLFQTCSSASFCG
jgi:hypothetical protein